MNSYKTGQKILFLEQLEKIYKATLSPRYNAKGVLTKTEQTKMEELKLPAVTICPRFFHQIISNQIRMDIG